MLQSRIVLSKLCLQAAVRSEADLVALLDSASTRTAAKVAPEAVVLG
jgi:hypothetical protein